MGKFGILHTEDKDVAVVPKRRKPAVKNTPIRDTQIRRYADGNTPQRAGDGGPGGERDKIVSSYPPAGLKADSRST